MDLHDGEGGFCEKPGNAIQVTVFCMLGHSMINQNEFCFEVKNLVIAGVLFSAL